METVKQRYICLTKTGRVIPVDSNGIALQRVGIDAFECDKSGKPVGALPKNASIESRIRQQQAAVREDYKTPTQASGESASPSRQRMAGDDAPKSEAQLKAEAEEKANLIQLAQEKHGVALDPTDSIDVIRSRFKMLGNSIPGGKQDRQRRKRGRKMKRRPGYKKSAPTFRPPGMMEQRQGTGT